MIFHPSPSHDARHQLTNKTPTLYPYGVPKAFYGDVWPLSSKDTHDVPDDRSVGPYAPRVYTEAADPS